MIAVRVASKEEVHDKLKAYGFEPTGEKTATGEFWENKEKGQFIQVPFSADGHYPNWMLWDLEEKANIVLSIPLAP